MQTSSICPESGFSSDSWLKGSLESYRFIQLHLRKNIYLDIVMQVRHVLFHLEDFFRREKDRKLHIWELCLKWCLLLQKELSVGYQSEKLSRWIDLRSRIGLWSSSVSLWICSTRVGPWWKQLKSQLNENDMIILAS